MPACHRDAKDSAPAGELAHFFGKGIDAATYKSFTAPATHSEKQYAILANAIVLGLPILGNICQSLHNALYIDLSEDAMLGQVICAMPVQIQAGGLPAADSAGPGRPRKRRVKDITPEMSAPFTFSSKADTLAALSRWPELNIPTVFAFTAAQWRANAGNVHARARAELGRGGDLRVAVRSSCRREDSAACSGAGAFLSLLDVPLDDAAAFTGAVDEVIASYGDAEPEDQVLVQPMIREPSVTGVIMTRALADGAPWYVINYDDESGKTDTVTGGTHVGKTVYVYREAREGDFDSPRLAAFVGLARRLEALCGTDALDIEFCLDAENTLHLLQVRPICAGPQWPESIPGARIGRVAEFVAGRTGSCPGLFGQRSILGVMPDWNPAEMIGILPVRWPPPSTATLSRAASGPRRGSAWAIARCRPRSSCRSSSGAPTSTFARASIPSCPRGSMPAPARSL